MITKEQRLLAEDAALSTVNPHPLFPSPSGRGIKGEGQTGSPLSAPAAHPQAQVSATSDASLPQPNHDHSGGTPALVSPNSPLPRGEGQGEGQTASPFRPSKLTPAQELANLRALLAATHDQIVEALKALVLEQHHRGYPDKSALLTGLVHLAAENSKFGDLLLKTQMAAQWARPNSDTP